VQAVLVGDCEDRHYIHLFTSDRRRQRCVLRPAELSVFTHKCAVGLSGDFVAASSTSGSYGRGNQSFDKWCGRQNDSLPNGWVIDEIEGKFSAENRAAEIHEHDDTGRAVNLLNSFLDADGVRAEGYLVQARGDRDRNRAAVQHLGCESHGGPGQSAAVRDNDDADEVCGRFVFRCCHYHSLAILR
jgi:hypothetical protein